MLLCELFIGYGLFKLFGWICYLPCDIGSGCMFCVKVVMFWCCSCWLVFVLSRVVFILGFGEVLIILRFLFIWYMLQFITHIRLYISIRACVACFCEIVLYNIGLCDNGLGFWCSPFMFIEIIFRICEFTRWMFMALRLFVWYSVCLFFCFASVNRSANLSGGN